MDASRPTPVSSCDGGFHGAAQASTNAVTVTDWKLRRDGCFADDVGSRDQEALFPHLPRDTSLVIRTTAPQPLLLIALMATSSIALLSAWWATFIVEIPVALGAWIFAVHGAAIGYWCRAVAMVTKCDRCRSDDRRSQTDELGNLGPYRLRLRIGSGGMGDIFLAEHTVLRRPCAIKIIRPDRVEDPINRARFEREIRVAAQMCHPHIVRIYDGGRLPNGAFYCAMEYLDGLSLQELVDQEGAVEGWRVVQYMEQLCAALSHAHRLQLVHRDLKPANIFITIRDGNEVAKLLDFGLVRQLDEDSELTIEGLVTGSPLYLSPEQATGESHADQRSDIYSLGAVMYFLLTERPPFCDSQTVQLLLAHAHRPPLAVSELNRHVSLELEALIMQCLAKRPDDRFRSADDLRDALRQCPECDW